MSNQIGSKDYDIGEHRHRFAVWTAARAVARGFTSTAKVKNAIDACGLRAFAFGDPGNWPADPELVDSLHKKWSAAILRQLEMDEVFEKKKGGAKRKKPLEKEKCYGWAAKIIAIYLKTIILMGCHWDHAFAKVMHPPIDRALLKELSKRSEFPASKSQWSKTNWTQLTEDDYEKLIASFRAARANDGEFWRIERFWNPEREEPSGETD